MFTYIRDNRRQVTEWERLSNVSSLFIPLFILLILQASREDQDNREKEGQNRAEKRVKRIEIWNELSL